MSSRPCLPSFSQPLATSPDPFFTTNPPDPRPPSPLFFLPALPRLAWLQWQIPAWSEMRQRILTFTWNLGAMAVGCVRAPSIRAARVGVVCGRLFEQRAPLTEAARTEAHASNVGQAGFAITLQSRVAGFCFCFCFFLLVCFNIVSSVTF